MKGLTLDHHHCLQQDCKDYPGNNGGSRRSGLESFGRSSPVRCSRFEVSGDRWKILDHLFRDLKYGGSCSLLERLTAELTLCLGKYIFLCPMSATVPGNNGSSTYPGGSFQYQAPSMNSSSSLISNFGFARRNSANPANSSSHSSIFRSRSLRSCRADSAGYLARSCSESAAQFGKLPCCASC